MKQKQSDISLYVDHMIVESFLESPSLVKNADGGIVQSFASSVKNYFDSKIDPNNKVESVLELLVPGAITVLFSALDFPKIGFLLSIAQQYFKIDVLSAISSIINSIKSMVSGGKQVSSQQVDSVVKNAFQSQQNSFSPEEEKALEQKLQDVKSEFRDVRLVKLAVIAYEEKNFEKFAALASGLQGRIVKIIISIFSWLFKIALASAGAIVISDTIHSFTGTSTTKDDSTSHKSTPPYIATQKVFPLKSENKVYNTGDVAWNERFQNNKAGIDNMLIQFAKDVYDGLDGLESTIQSLPTFNEVSSVIEHNNLSSPGANIVFIPRIFTTKKQIVDLFIDDVAKKAQPPHISTYNNKL